MDSKVRSVECRVWSVECSGVCRVESAEWRVQSGECRVESAERRVQSGECRVESGECKVRGKECRCM